MSKKSFKPLIMLGSRAASLLIADDFYIKKRRDNRKKIKWLSWEIELKEGTSESEKAKIINAIEKHLIDYLYRQDLDGVIIRSIKFSYKGNHNIFISISVRFDNVAAEHGYKYPPPPPPPPVREALKNLSSFIVSVRSVPINEKFNDGGFE